VFVFGISAFGKRSTERNAAGGMVRAIAAGAWAIAGPKIKLIKNAMPRTGAWRLEVSVVGFMTYK